MIGGWEISPIVSFRTGWPMPVFGAGQLWHLRSWRSGQLQLLADLSRIHLFQMLAVSGSSTMGILLPAPAPSAIAHRNSQVLRSPQYTDLDFSLHKNFQITERFRLQFRTDFINALNHPPFNAPNMSLGQTMGQITSAQPPRNIQLALKVLLLTTKHV